MVWANRGEKILGWGESATAVKIDDEGEQRTDRREKSSGHGAGEGNRGVKTSSSASIRGADRP